MKVNRLLNNSLFSIMVWCPVKLPWENLLIDHTLSDKEHRPWNQPLPKKKLRMGVDLGSKVPKKGIKINTISQSSKAWKSVWCPYATPKVTKYQRCIFIIQIHKFTIKIDTISINLLFECVKIVEFNFNSHVFVVMYQDIRFLNQDACFFKSRRETRVFDHFCFREGLKTKHRLEFKMASDRFYIPLEMKVKFSKVYSPFCSTARTVWKKIPMGGTQNFLQDVKRNINSLCVICGWCMVELRSLPRRINLLRIWNYQCR